MRILYFGNNRVYATERYVRHGLIQNGCEVVLKQVRSLTFETMIRYVDQHKPNFVLFSKPHNSDIIPFIKWCQRRRLPTVCWNWDLYWGYRPHKPPQFDCDLLFTTDGGHDHLWEKHYPQHRVLRQGIHKPDSRLFPMKYKWDVGFVGTILRTHTGRQRLVKQLQEEYGKRFRLLTNVRGQQLNKELARIRVIVGDSYPSDSYWSNRIYEMLGRGGFLIYPHTTGLDEEFEEGKHYVGFVRNDYADLFGKIEDSLGNPIERERIRRAGFYHVNRNLTYTHRCKVLVDAVSSYLSSAPSAQVRSPAVGG